MNSKLRTGLVAVLIAIATNSVAFSQTKLCPRNVVQTHPGYCTFYAVICQNGVITGAQEWNGRCDYSPLGECNSAGCFGQPTGPFYLSADLSTDGYDAAIPASNEFGPTEVKADGLIIGPKSQKTISYKMRNKNVTVFAKITTFECQLAQNPNSKITVRVGHQVQPVEKPDHEVTDREQVVPSPGGHCHRVRIDNDWYQIVTSNREQADVRDAELQPPESEPCCEGCGRRRLLVRPLLGIRRCR